MVEPRDEWVVIQWWVNPRCKFEAHINLYDLDEEYIEESFWQQSLLVVDYEAFFNKYYPELR